DRRAKARCLSRVSDQFVAAHIRDAPTEAVGGQFAAVELELLPNLGAARRRQELVSAKSFFPSDHVVDGRDDRAGAHQVGEIAVAADEPPVARLIAGRTPFDDVLWIALPGSRHAERYEYSLAHKIHKGFSALCLDNVCEQVKAAVAVYVLFPGRELERVRRELFDKAFDLYAARKFEAAEARVALDPRGVGQKVADRHVLPRLGRARQIARDRLVEPDLALFHEQHDAGRGHLFRNRADLKDSIVGDGNVEFDTCQAVCLLFYDLAAA